LGGVGFWDGVIFEVSTYFYVDTWRSG
jgi:hypothetical protein